MQRKFCFSNFIFIGKFFENDIITFFTIFRYLFSISRYWGLFNIQITQLMTSNCIMLAVKFEITFSFRANVCQELGIRGILPDTKQRKSSKKTWVKILPNIADNSTTHYALWCHQLCNLNIKQTSISREREEIAKNCKESYYIIFKEHSDKNKIRKTKFSLHRHFNYLFRWQE